MSSLGMMIKAMERGWLPDSIIRFGSRQLCRQRVKEALQQGGRDHHFEMVRQLEASDVAEVPEVANEQHYEIPPEFFKIVLGDHLKYSCCEWPSEITDLSEAEKVSLKTTMERAELVDGQKVLELGCGWGSLTLSMAETFPNSEFTGVSNSNPQRRYITSEAERRGLKNVQIITQDINQLELELNSFDRVVSVEMFEHVKNYDVLLNRISHWLKDEGKLFVHHFSHVDYAYAFETEGAGNWMGQYFFTGGMMPNHHLLRSFDKDLEVVKDWWWEGTHYEKTANAWLERMDQNKDKIMGIFKQTYGKDAHIWFQRWRVFFIGCAECFGLDEGVHWGVSHLLLEKKIS